MEGLGFKVQRLRFRVPGRPRWVHESALLQGWWSLWIVFLLLACGNMCKVWCIIVWRNIVHYIIHTHTHIDR